MTVNYQAALAAAGLGFDAIPAAIVKQMEPASIRLAADIDRGALPNETVRRILGLPDDLRAYLDMPHA